VTLAAELDLGLEFYHIQFTSLVLLTVEINSFLVTNTALCLEMNNTVTHAVHRELLSSR
jgi:hypothetical protein